MVLCSLLPTEESDCCAPGNPQLSLQRLSMLNNQVWFSQKLHPGAQQDLEETWKGLKIYPFSKRGKKSKGKMLAKTQFFFFFFFFHSVKRNHTKKWLSIKRFHLTGEDGIEQEERSFSCSHANAICTSQNSLLVAREKELVSLGSKSTTRANVVSPHIYIAFCLSKAASCAISTAFLLNVGQELSTHFTDERMQSQDFDVLEVPSQERLRQDVRSLQRKAKRIFSFLTFPMPPFLVAGTTLGKCHKRLYWW